jgi:hypothetical protein
VKGLGLVGDALERLVIRFGALSLDELTTSGRAMTPDLRAGCLRHLSATPAVVCLDNAETPL